MTVVNKFKQNPPIHLIKMKISSIGTSGKSLSNKNNFSNFNLVILVISGIQFHDKKTMIRLFHDKVTIRWSLEIEGLYIYYCVLMHRLKLQNVRGASRPRLSLATSGLVVTWFQCIVCY